MKKLGRLAAPLVALVMIACGAPDPTIVAGNSQAACAGPQCVDILLVFANPEFPAGTGAGGGIIAPAPQSVDLPDGVGAFRLIIDDSLGLLMQPPIDSAVYSLRLASIVVADANFNVYNLDTTDAMYHVPAGTVVSLYAVWQSVAAVPSDRGVAANSVASIVDFQY